MATLRGRGGIKSEELELKNKTNPEELLKEPYLRMLIPDKETGTYTAQIMEFPGCIAEGNSPEEAYDALEKVAVSWIEAAVDSGQDIPQPLSTFEYAGKVALRLPRSLHRQATLAAERDGTSLNQYIVMALAEKIGGSKVYDSIVGHMDKLFAQITFTAANMGVAPRNRASKIRQT